MQLQLERQRQRGLHQYHSLAGVQSSLGNDHPSAVPYSAAAAAAAGVERANGGIVVTSNSIGGVSTSHPMTMGSHLWTNVTSASKGGHATVGASVTSSAANTSGLGGGTFLLTQISDEDSSDKSLDERKKRELFVEELVLASLANTKIHDS